MRSTGCRLLDVLPKRYATCWRLVHEDGEGEEGNRYRPGVRGMMGNGEPPDAQKVFEEAVPTRALFTFDVGEVVHNFNFRNFWTPGLFVSYDLKRRVCQLTTTPDRLLRSM